MNNDNNVPVVPDKRSAPRQFWENLVRILTGVAAAAVAAWVLASLSAVWVYLSRNPGVPLWFLVVAVVTILFAYFSLFFLHRVFAEFQLSDRRTVHVVIIGLLVVTVAVPVALLQSLTHARTNALTTGRDQLLKELKDTRDAQAARDGERLELYSQVTGTLTRTLQQPTIDPANLADLLHFCVESIALNKPATQQHILRAAAVYLDRGGKFLVVPSNGYWGYALDQNIRRLYFDVSPQKDGERIEAYRQRLGVAGWAYVQKSAVHDADVQVIKPEKPWRYKPGVAPEEQTDHAMICVLIPDLNDASGQRSIGVLSVSSTTPGVLTANDLAVASFFATLLGKSQTPAETPPWLLTADTRK